MPRLLRPFPKPKMIPFRQSLDPLTRLPNSMFEPLSAFVAFFALFSDLYSVRKISITPELTLISSVRTRAVLPSRRRLDQRSDSENYSSKDRTWPVVPDALVGVIS